MIVTDTFPFPEGAVVSTPQGLVRTSRDAGNRTCGCGQPAVTVLHIARIKGRSGARTGNSSDIPLCARHDAARDEQGRRRDAARVRAWHARDAAMRAARAAQREYMDRPVIGFTLAGGWGTGDGEWDLIVTAPKTEG